MYRLATKDSDRLKLTRINSRLQFETVNKQILMLTTAIPDNDV